MKNRSLFLILLLAVMMPWAAMAQKALPYNYGFENNDLDGEGWTKVTCHNSTGINSSAAKTGSYGFRFYYRSINSTNPNQYLVSPELTGTSNGVNVTFYYKNSSSSYEESFQVGYSTSSNDPTTFTYGTTYKIKNQTWTQFEEDFPANTKYIGIKLLSNDAYYLYLDDFSFTVPATCPKPTLSSTVTTTANTATISWTPADASQTLFDIYWSTSNTDPTDATTPSAANQSGTSYQITGLNAATQYYAWIRGNCGTAADPDISGGWTSAVSFVTDCEAVGIGYTCGFEGPNTGGTTSYPLPVCWTRITEQTSSLYPYVYNYGTPRTGSYHLYFYSSNNASAQEIAILPEIDGGLNGKRLSFYQKGAYSFSVGYMTDPTNASTFVAVETKTGSSSYQLFEVDFGEYTGDPRYIAIKSNFTSTYQSMYFDDVALVNSPTCFRPTMATTATNIEYNTATVSWTAGSTDQDHWDVYYCSGTNTAPTASTTPQVTNTGDNPCTLTGLEPTTKYYVYVRGNCGAEDGVSEWSTNYCTFTTAESCPAPVLAEPTNTTAYGATLTWTGTSDHYDVMVGQETITTILNADFEDNQIPSDLTNSTTYPWTITDADKHAGTYAIKSGGAGTAYAQSDLTLVLELTNAATISFWYKASSESGYDYGRFLINGTQKFQTSGTTNSWTQYTFDLTTGTNTLVWRYYKDSGTDSGDDCFYVDDIKITSSTVGTWQVAATNVTESPYVLSNNTVLSPETDYQVKLKGYCPWTNEETESNVQSFTTSSSCETPTGLAESEVTNESAKITWETYGLTTFNLRYRTGTEEWETKNNVACPYTIEGLDGNTTYEVQVQATCNTTEWSTALSFTTKCDPVTDLPWSEDFENYSAGNFSDPCWVNEHIAGSSTYVFQVSTSTQGTNSTHQLQLPDQNSGNMTKLVLPGVTLPNNNYAFFIDVYRTDNYSSYTTEGIRVFASTNGEIEGATELAFIPRVRSVGSGIIPAEDAIGWYTYALPINMSGNCYIILRGESQYGNATYMDNFIVASCYPVGTLSLVEYGSTSAKLSWTLMDDTQTAWDVAYKMEGETNFTIVSANTNENYLLEGLTAEKAYTVKVRANCGGGDYGVWSNEINFTTPEACPIPFGLAINEATKTAVTADLSWTGSIDVTSYDIRYRTAAGYDGIDEQFNTSSLPSGWTKYTGLVDNVIAGSATLSTGGNWGTSTYALGSYNAKLNIYGTNRKDWLVTPEIDLPTGAGMSFKLALTDFSSADPIEDPTAQADDRFVVLVYADNQWTSLREWNNSGSEYVYNTIATTGETVNDIDISRYVGKTVKFAFYGESTASGGDNDLHIDDVIIGAPIAVGAWNDPLLTSNTTNVQLTDLAGGTKYDVQVRSGCSTSDADWSETLQFTTLAEGNMVFTNATADGKWGTAGNWVPAQMPVLTNEVILRANATIESGCVAQAKKITFEGTPTPTLTIADGGQLITNTEVTATVQKVINAHGATTADGGWYFIASPINSSYYSATSTGLNLITDNYGSNIPGGQTASYDLYSFLQNPTLDENGVGNEWRNYRKSTFSLANGKGYLYASLNGTTLNFSGSIKALPTTASQAVSLTYASENETQDMSYRGWNLVGNPFTFETYVNKSYYKMNEDGSTVVPVDAYQTTAIAPCTGIMVQATESGQSVTFSKEAPSSQTGNQGNLNIALAQANVRNNSIMDKAILSFNEGSQLSKFYFGQNKANIYFPQDNEPLAIVSSEGQGEMPLNFKAYENGSYTLSFGSQNASFNYLRLIDNLTGAEVDLLQTPSYTFNATTTDYESRFKLVFCTGVNDDSDSFAFCSNGNWIINNPSTGSGSAILQVIDVTGRILSSETVNGSVSKAIHAAPGVYMLRLINGDNVKVQKIVVR